MRTVIGLLLAVAVSAVLVAHQDSDGAVPLHLLKSGDLGVPGYDGVTGVASFAANSSTGWHTHPGAMVGYVVEGAVSVEMAGKASVVVTTGESFIVPSGIAHAEVNVSKSKARVFITYIVDPAQRLRTNVEPQ